MSDRSKHKLIGDFDIAQAGYIGARRLNSPAALALAEMDIHVRTLQALAAPSSAVDRLVATYDGSDDADGMIAALWTGIVVQYCRCFETTSRWRLNPAKVFARTDDSFWQNEHASLVSIRSKHVAHDINNLRIADVGIEVEDDGALGRLLRPYAQFSPAEADLASLAILIGMARSYAEAERSRLTRIVVLEVNAMTNEDRLELPALKYEKLGRASIKATRRQVKSGDK